MEFLLENLVYVLPAATILVIAIIGGLLKLAAWKGRIDADRNRLKELNLESWKGTVDSDRNRVKALNLESWKAEVDADRNHFKEFMKEIRDDIKRIYSAIEKIRDDLKTISRRYPPPPSPPSSSPPPSIHSGSPLMLSDMGKDISTQLQAHDWAEEKAAELEEQSRGKPPYDIQELSLDYVRRQFTPDPALEAKIKQCAYEKGLDLDGVLYVLAIELRDSLLKKSEDKQSDDSE